MWYLMLALIVLTIMFEVYENLPQQIKKYRRIEISESKTTSYRGDSGINIIGDIIFNVIGVYLGYKLKTMTSLITLFITFIGITRTVGFSYWTEFISFLVR